MKVFDLACERGHGFEGWFASDDDHRSQLERGLLTCPLCGSAQVSRRPSAPRLNLQTARGDVVRAQGPESPPVPHEGPGSSVAPQVAERLQALQVAYVEAVRQVLAHTEDVGSEFAQEARRIHYGEAPSRGIRGQTSSEDLEALRDEGVEVLSLPIPPGLDRPIH